MSGEVVVRVLMTSTSGAGHLHPLVPIARSLEAAGDEVIWAIAPEAVSTVESFGMRARPAGLDRSEVMVRAIAGWPDLLEQFFVAEPRDRRRILFPVMFAAVQAPVMLNDLRGIIDVWRPDVIVHEPNELAAAPLAEARGIPHVVVGFGGFEPVEPMVAADHHLRRLWSSEGLELATWAGLYDDLYLNPFPPSFATPPPLGTIRPMRPVGFDGVDTVVPPDWLEGFGASRPGAYVTFGTEIAALAPFDVAVNAFEGVDIDVLVTVGRDLDPDSLGSRPPNVRVERYVPQRLALTNSSLLVSHAGSGAVLGAAAHGIPQLCLPMAADQFDNADAVAAAGSGLSLDPHEVNVDSVHRSIRRLLDGSFEAPVRAVAWEIAEMPEPDACVGRIHALFARG